MPLRLFSMLVVITTIFTTNALAADPVPHMSAEQMIAQCEQKSGENRFHLHRCLLQQYEVLQKKADILIDKLLGMVGGHKPFGRYKKIRWSEAIAKGHSLWQKLLPKDCEWEAHILPSLKGASVAIDRCGIIRTLERIQILEKRVKTLNTVLINQKHTDK